MRGLILTATLCATLGCHSEVRDSITDPEMGPLVRYSGAVRLALTAAMIAPGKDSGLPWDGPGRMPDEVAQRLRERPSQRLLGSLFRGLTLGSTGAVVGSLLPWAVGAFNEGSAAPDVEAVVSLNGQILVRAAKVANSYYPTWSSAYTDPIVIGDYDAVEIKAIDKDVLFDDHIGVCTSRGMPYVNQEGYASARTFICHGQLWAVALRVSPVLR